MKKILLYSGGMDSYLIDKLWEPDEKVYIDMHTRYSAQEIENIKRQNLDVKIIDFPLGQWERDNAIIPLRNLYLPMVICNYTEDEDVDICLGATKTDRVLDKSKEFAQKATDLMNYLYQPQWWIPNGKRVRINVDFKDYTKEDLLRMYKEQGGDLDKAFKESFSCYNPGEDGQVCGCCKPCFRKFVAFDSIGYDFPKDLLDKTLKHIETEILPQIEAGTYGRPDEEPHIVNFYKKYSNQM